MEDPSAQLATEAIKSAASTGNAKSTAQSTTSSGQKRKRGADMKFYAVRAGKTPGIYHNWKDCQEQITKHKGSVFKSFTSLTEAEAFMKADESNSSSAATPSKFYGVQNGRIPGVYTDWPSAQKQITGWTKPKHKSFSTRAEAYAFVQAGQSDGSPIPNVNIDPDDSASQPQSKKAKRDNKKETATPVPMDRDSLGELNPMLAPLPSDAEDGFDRRMIMDLETGEMRWKTPEELSARKLMYKPDNYADSMSIYTDGACRGNGKKGAFGGVGVYFGPQDPRNVAEPLPGTRQTNQRAELTALKRALDIAPLNRNVTIFSDSSYSINCVTTWYVSWRKNNWQTASKKPVENRDLVEEILKMIEDRKKGGFQTTFTWLKGHADDPGNIAADRLAVQGAEEGKRMREELGKLLEGGGSGGDEI